MPSVSVNVFVRRPAAEVFDFLADARNLALWSSGVASVDSAHVPPGPSAVYRYRYPGRRRAHRLVCAHFEPCRRIAFRGQRMWTPLGTQIPVYGFDLLPHADGTLVRLSVTSSLTAALLLLAPMVAMAWRRDLPTDGRKLCEVLGGASAPAVQPSAAPVAAPSVPAAGPTRTSPSAAPSSAAASSSVSSVSSVPPATSSAPSSAPHGFDFAH